MKCLLYAFYLFYRLHRLSYCYNIFEINNNKGPIQINIDECIQDPGKSDTQQYLKLVLFRLEKPLCELNFWPVFYDIPSTQNVVLGITSNVTKILIRCFSLLKVVQCTHYVHK